MEFKKIPKKNMNITFKKGRYTLHISKEWKELLGSKPFCSFCSAFLSLPFWFCIDTNKFFCVDCAKPKGKIKIQAEKCKLCSIKDHHYHYCITKVEIDGEKEQVKMK